MMYCNDLNAYSFPSVHVSPHSAAHAARFYRALYAQLLSPQFIHSTKNNLFLNLLYRVLRHCKEEEVVYGLIKRVLQCCLMMNVGMCCGLLFMVSTVLRERNDVVVKGDLKTLIKNGAFEKAMEKEEVKDEVKEEKKPEKKEEVKEEKEEEEKKPTEAMEEEGDDEVMDLNEAFFDEQEPKDKEEEKEESSEEEEVPAVPEEAKDDKTPLSPISTTVSSLVYQFASRDPGFSNANQTLFFELSLLAQHYHPTVAKFASLLLSGQAVHCSGDPLQDFSNKAFLDKFA